MLLRNDDRRYGAVAQLLHWVTVALFVYLFYLAWTMTDLPLGPEKFKLYNLHKSLGVTILGIAVLRLLWRHVTPPPPLPDNLPGWEAGAARLGHIALYLLVFLQVSVGIVHSWSANFPVIVFNLFTLPNVTGPNESLKDVLGPVHAILGWAFFVLILGHVAAALRHHLVHKDGVLLRMIPGTDALQKERE
jgi:cytochrome b561